MNPAAPMDQIQMIRRSVRCFVFGMLSFIPVLGLAMGIIAWIHGTAVRRRGAAQWNPAEGYLRWGRVLGLIGGLASLVMFGFILLAVLNATSS